MTLPTRPPGGSGSGPRHPKGTSAGGRFDFNRHSEPDLSLRSSLGQPSREDQARREIGDALLEPFKEMLSRGRPYPQDYVLEANPDGILVGAALDGAGREIPGSRQTVGGALLEKGIQAEDVLSQSDMAAGQLVVPCTEVNEWRSADEDAADARQPGPLAPLPIPTRPAQQPQRPKRPTLSTDQPKPRKLPGRPPLPADQTPSPMPPRSTGLPPVPPKKDTPDRPRFRPFPGGHRKDKP